jgi:hypothetical protein
VTEDEWRAAILDAEKQAAAGIRRVRNMPRESVSSYLHGWWLEWLDRRIREIELAYYSQFYDLTEED